MPEHLNETADEREHDGRIRVDALPERPPCFTIRAQILDGHRIMAERGEDYLNLYDAIVALGDLGTKLGQKFEEQVLRSIIPEGDLRERL